MGPYLAVIKDSFHAALASRVLWIAFLAIWLFLAGLALIGYREEFTTTFLGRDFDNGTRLKAMLAEGLVDPQAAQTPIGRLARAMPEDLRKLLRQVGQGDEVRIQLSRLADGLNESLDDETWYDAEAWASTLRLRELRDLDELAADQITEAQRRRRARLRIEAALPGVFRARPSRSIILTYAGMDFPARFRVDKSQFVTLINQWVVPTIIDWLLGFILVFLGILVTASVVPDMLQPGSLHLLLSKPVSRSMLLLSKFVGGCAFVLLCVVQLVVGLYLIAGWRLDLWNIRLMWCIPVSVFLFAVFYSVSVVAGLKWRSPILAIGITCMFGALCFLIGLIGGLFDGLVTGPDRIRHIAVGGGAVVASTRGSGLSRFDSQLNRWVEIIESDAMTGDRVLSPIRLDDSRFATAQVRGGRFNPFGSGSHDLLVLGPAGQWQPEPSVRLPTGTTRLYSTNSDTVFALTTGNLFATDRDRVLLAAGEKAKKAVDSSADPSVSSDQAANDAGKLDVPGWLARLTGMQGGAAEGFRDVLPPEISLMSPRAIAIEEQGQSLVVLSRDRLMRLEAIHEDKNDPWSITAERYIEGEPSREAVLAISGRQLMVCRAEEPIRVFDVIELRPLGQVTLPSSISVVAATAVGEDGKFAISTSDGRCRMVSTQGEPVGDSASAVQLDSRLPTRDVETLRFDSDARALIVVHHIDQVDWFDWPDLSVKRRVRPQLSRWRWVDRYVVTPLRTLTPQTGEVGQTIAAMVSGKSAIAISGGRPEDVEVVRYHVVRPLASCAGFMVFMLTVGCVYFSRSDF